MKLAPQAGTVKSTGAFLSGWLASAAPQLLVYLDGLDSPDDFSVLAVLQGAVMSLVSALAVLFGYRARSPVETEPPDLPVEDEREVDGPVTPTASRWRFSSRSLRNLEECRPELKRVAMRALQLTPVDFVVVDGRRTLVEQTAHVESGASRTQDSRHVEDPSAALDFIPLGNGSLDDAASYEPVVRAFRQAGAELGVAITLGHDWGWDSGHVELDRGVYPPDIDLGAA